MEATRTGESEHFLGLRMRKSQVHLAAGARRPDQEAQVKEVFAEMLGFQMNLFPEAAAKDRARLPQVTASGNPFRDPLCGEAVGAHRPYTVSALGHRG